MNVYSLDLRTMEWISSSSDPIIPYNDFYINSNELIYNGTNFVPLPKISNHIFDAKFDSYNHKKFQKIFLYQKKQGAYSSDYLINKFNFIQTTENNILRYICKKFPFVLDCIYDDDDKKIVKNAVIVSYIDSSYYLFSPAKVSYLLPLFVLDDVLGDDFFCDFDFLCINKKYLSQVEKAVDILLKANENKLLGICPLLETKDKHFSQIVNDFDNASYQRFIISIRRLDATNFVANNYRTLIIVLAIIVLSLVILYKFNVFMILNHFNL